MVVFCWVDRGRVNKEMNPNPSLVTNYKFEVKTAIIQIHSHSDNNFKKDGLLSKEQQYKKLK